MKAFTAYPREGWIRASQVADAKMSAELARLSAENSELRAKLDAMNRSQNDARDKELRETADILFKNKRDIHVWLKDATAYEVSKNETLFDIFLHLSPELVIEKSVEDMSRYAAQMICFLEPHNFRWEYPVPANEVKSWMADFFALGLATPSNRKKPVSDKNEYWTLTEKGNELLHKARRLMLEKGAKKATQSESNQKN